MRLGVTPLAISVAAAAARLIGAEVTADVLAYTYLALATVIMTRDTELKAAQRI
jgi:hypothetical protein